MKSSYFWSVDEERTLGKLWREGVTDPEILAARLKRKPEAIRKKLQRLGLVVGRDKTAGTTTNGVRSARLRLCATAELNYLKNASI